MSSTANILYNILNYEEPNIICNYFIILVIFIFIFSNINFSITLFIGLIFFSIFIYFLHTDRTVNNINETEKINEKFKLINPTSNILYKYPDIVDIIFYIEDMRKFNIPEFNDILQLFEEFIKLYEASLVDYSFIDNSYSNLLNIKIKILYKLNSLLFSTFDNNFTTKIISTKNNTENVLNKYLNEIVLIHNKKLYYNGYNYNTKILDTSNILPYNYLYSIKDNNLSNNNANMFIYD